MAYAISSVLVQREPEVVLARQRTRQVAMALGFDAQDQTRLATAVSELARNAYGYAKGGKIEFQIEGQTAPQVFIIRISDKGPGIPHLKTILDGRYRSSTGMGLGIVGARRLVDQCDIQTGPKDGTTIVLKKMLSRRAPLVSTARLNEIAGLLAAERPESAFDEVKRQNQELLQALSDARERQEELAQVNQELEDTNRGVVALYAELDERASHLRRADEIKTRFLSEMSHEFRTPLSSILALSGLLLEHADGDLTGEQEKQVGFIRKSAEGLLELVNDLLDLAKIEAGKIEVRPIEFAVPGLFSAVRGMLRPLLVGQTVSLVFEDAKEIPPLFGDENKVSQILRNFISNALKFTERGAIRVTAQLNQTAQMLTFAVADTGIGIALEDQAKIFEEFTQVESPIQRKVKGTGLGLPLCRKLAGLLGGQIDLISEVGVGSTFSLTIPLNYVDARAAAAAPAPGWQIDESRILVLIVEDEAETRLIYEKYLGESPFQALAVSSLRQGRDALRQYQPRAIILDIALRGENAWNWLAELKADETTRDIPIMIASAVEDRGKGFALGADAYCVKPLERAELLDQLQRLTGAALNAEQDQPPDFPKTQVVIIDDEPAARYILSKLLWGKSCRVQEAENGFEGLRMIKASSPQLIFLDLAMPDLSGFEVLNSLKTDALTQSIPVAVVTSATLTEAHRRLLEAQTCAIINKTELSRERIEDLWQQVIGQ
ncbi:MAG TPA: ATP-binding protein [Verrucomicrobiae bacterium]|nr:ATP-binding protein [Verrucomicrobiae bacterium]